MNYTCFTFQTVSPEQKDHLIALLSSQGINGFEEKDKILEAYIETDKITRDLQVLIEELNVKYCKSIVEDRNWNEDWERDFNPVSINGNDESIFVHIRADFHPSFGSAEHELVITPKMSFGTGHHATTHMMVELMRNISFNGKSVFDFGTGTGVLAILASQLGAKKITAIDYDACCIENAGENVAINQSGNIELLQSDSLPPGEVDIILANINLNIIIENLDGMFLRCRPGGTMLLSGMLVDDIPVLNAALKSMRDHTISLIDKDNWIAALIHVK